MAFFVLATITYLLAGGSSSISFGIISVFAAPLILFATEKMKIDLIQSNKPLIISTIVAGLFAAMALGGSHGLFLFLLIVLNMCMADMTRETEESNLNFPL